MRGERKLTSPPAAFAIMWMEVRAELESLEKLASLWRRAAKAGFPSAVCLRVAFDVSRRAEAVAATTAGAPLNARMVKAIDTVERIEECTNARVLY